MEKSWLMNDEKFEEAKKVSDDKGTQISLNLKDVKERANKSWSEKEIEFLKENYGQASPILIAEILGRSVGSIHQKAVKEGIAKTTSMSKNNKKGEKRTVWSKKDEKYLKKNYKHVPTKEIANTLGKSRSSIIGKARRMNLSIPINYDVTKANWTEEDDKILDTLYKIKSVTEIAKELKRTPSSIRTRISKKAKERKAKARKRSIIVISSILLVVSLISALIIFM